QTRRPSAGTPQEPSDLRANRGLARWLVPLEDLSFAATSGQRRGRHRGEGHRIHPGRDGPRRGGQSASAADDSAGRRRAPGGGVGGTVPRTLGGGTGHRRTENAPPREGGVAFAGAGRSGSGDRGAAVGALRGSRADAGGSATRGARPGEDIV